ncbi:hypothetical protein [Verminephrobacter aporrectodeae]|nr:hypothetical protein [Verminephrobacter aporrectodeae]
MASAKRMVTVVLSPRLSLLSAIVIGLVAASVGRGVPPVFVVSPERRLGLVCESVFHGALVVDGG